MTFPKIEHPLYEIYLVSLDKKIKFRPFLVKEEKLLLMAKESKDREEIKRAMKQIITNCSAEPIDVDKLPLFDIEMLFINLRARSVGENVKLTFNCQNIIDKETSEACNADTDYTLNLDKVRYNIPEGHDSKIRLTDKMGVKMKYPDISTGIIGDNVDEYTAALQIIAQNIEYVFDEDSVYKAEDMGVDQLLDFIENLTEHQLAKVQKFFSSSPKVILEDLIKCSKCGFEHKVEAGDILSFFM